MSIKQKSRRLSTYILRSVVALLILAFIVLHFFLITRASSVNWRLTKVGNSRQVEGYVNKSSFEPGDEIEFHISCTSGSFSADIFRMGWYSGKGARQVDGLTNVDCQKQIMPRASKSTGLVNPSWPITFSIRVPSAWQSGIYLAKLTGADGFQNYVPFLIRASSPHSPYLFVDSNNTAEAYNHWGGNSLYTGKTPDLHISRGVEVSLNRPYLENDGDNDGSGDFFRWEYPMIQLLEKYGYPCDYLTDVDIHEHPDILLKYKTVITVGHDEYWSQPMMDGYKNAVKKGVNLAFFGANIAYRPIRYLPDPYTGEPDRIIVNYKSAELDPENGNKMGITVTAHNWDAPPNNEPESELLGVYYGNESYDRGEYRSPLVVNDGRSWILNGTGLKKGDEIPGIVGYEYDKYTTIRPHPDNVDVVFRSPIINVDGQADHADAGYYKLPGGGAVFDAGTIDWATGLDIQGKYYSPALVKITRNVLDNIGRAP